MKFIGREWQSLPGFVGVDALEREARATERPPEGPIV